MTTPPPTALPALGPEDREIVVMALRDFAESEREYALDRDTPEDLAERAPLRERAARADAIADALLRLAQPEESGLTEEEEQQFDLAYERWNSDMADSHDAWDSLHDLICILARLVGPIDTRSDDG